MMMIKWGITHQIQHYSELKMKKRLKAYRVGRMAMMNDEDEKKP